MALDSTQSWSPYTAYAATASASNPFRLEGSGSSAGVGAGRVPVVAPSPTQAFNTRSGQTVSVNARPLLPNNTAQDYFGVSQPTRMAGFQGQFLNSGTSLDLRA
jgi:hypothetical protein